MSALSLLQPTAPILLDFAVTFLGLSVVYT